MVSAMVALGISLVVTTLLTPFVRLLAVRLGAVDDPGGRRVHQRATPRLGGLAILVGFFAPLAVLPITQSTVSSMFFEDPSRILGLSIGGGLVAALGVWDDLRGASPANKLAIHAIAASVAYGCGFRIDAVVIPGVGPLSMGIFGLPVTVFWFLAIINAVNLIDGLDGLAAGIGLFACVANFVVASFHDSALVVLLSACLGGALLGFLRYNFNPAKIFMGDTGSMFLGFVLAATSLMGATVKSSTAVAILVPIIALGVPIVDTLLAMVRRAVFRRPIFSADRGHIHHRLLDVGLTHRHAVLSLYGLSILLTAAAILLVIGKDWEVGAALVVVAVVVGAMVRMARAFDVGRLARVSAEERSQAIAELRSAVRRAVLSIDEDGAKDRLPQHLERVRAETSLRGLHLRETTDLELAGSEPTESIVFDFGIAGYWYSLSAELDERLKPAGADVDVLVAMLADACEQALRRVHVVAGATPAPPNQLAAHGKVSRRA